MKYKHRSGKKKTRRGMHQLAKEMTGWDALMHFYIYGEMPDAVDRDTYREANIRLLLKCRRTK